MRGNARYPALRVEVVKLELELCCGYDKSVHVDGWHPFVLKPSLRIEFRSPVLVELEFPRWSGKIEFGC